MREDVTVKEAYEYALSEGKRTERESMRCETCRRYKNGCQLFNILSEFSFYQDLDWTQEEFGCVEHEPEEKNL